MIRMGNEVMVSDWFHFALVVKKSNEPDSFNAHVEITDSIGNTITFLKFTDTTKNKVTASMWNLSRIHVGFNAAVNQYGLTSIDNIKMAVTE